MTRRVTWTNNSTDYDGANIYRDATIDPMNLPEPIATVGPVDQSVTAEWIDNDGAGDQCYAVRDFDSSGNGPLSEAYCFGDVEAASAQYWRIHVTDTDVDSSFMVWVAEAQFRREVGAGETPSGGTAIGSAHAGSGFEYDKAFDADPDTGWSSPGDGTLPHWVGYDFGSDHSAAEVMIQAGDTSGRANRAPLDFTIDYSDDGSIWTTLASISDEPLWSIGEIRTYDISNVSPPFLYWRILATDSNSGDSFEVGIAELQFRESAGQTETHTGGTAFGSTYAALGFEYDKSFDDDASTGWVSEDSATLPQHVGYQFAESRDVAEIFMQAMDTQARADRCPTEFTLQGSNDGKVWFDVDSYSGLSAWSPGETRTFSVG